MSNSNSNQQSHVVEINDLTRCFGRKRALQRITLSVKKGTVFGLVGENGAGKTTLIKHILGSHYAQQGSVRVFGLDPTLHHVEVLSRLGYVSEDREMPGWIRVRDLISYTASFYPNWDGLYANELLEMFALDLTTRAKNLSRGQRARLSMLLALAYRPELLVLDEPSSGLDPLVRKDILTAIIRTIADEGRTVIFSSHLLDEVERVADQVAILHQGVLVANDDLDSLKSDYIRCILKFADLTEGNQKAPNLLGVRATKVSATEWEYVCKASVEKLQDAAKSIHGEVISTSAPSLEQIFSALSSSEPAPSHSDFSNLIVNGAAS